MYRFSCARTPEPLRAQFPGAWRARIFFTSGAGAVGEPRRAPLVGSPSVAERHGWGHEPGPTPRAIAPRASRTPRVGDRPSRCAICARARLPRGMSGRSAGRAPEAKCGGAELRRNSAGPAWGTAAGYLAVNARRRHNPSRPCAPTTTRHHIHAGPRASEVEPSSPLAAQGVMHHERHGSPPLGLPVRTGRGGGGDDMLELRSRDCSSLAWPLHRACHGSPASSVAIARASPASNIVNYVW